MTTNFTPEEIRKRVLPHAREWAESANIREEPLVVGKTINMTTIRVESYIAGALFFLSMVPKMRREVEIETLERLAALNCSSCEDGIPSRSAQGDDPEDFWHDTEPIRQLCTAWIERRELARLRG